MTDSYALIIMTRNLMLYGLNIWFMIKAFDAGKKIQKKLNKLYKRQNVQMEPKIED